MIFTVKRKPFRPIGLMCCAIVSSGLILGAMLPASAAGTNQTPDVAQPVVASFDASEYVWNQVSKNGVFNVTLDPQSDPKADGAIEINQFLEWILTIKTPDGLAVTPARVAVGGGMPMHGHGLPSQPQVSEYLGDGKYLIKGLMFSMNGRWTIELDINSKSLRDQVVFEIVVDY